MVTDEPAREVAKRLKDAGFIRVSTDGRHSKWRHPSGVWVPVSESHRMISAGVVRKINRAIEESKGKRQ
ncbi:type II toxin-antitoxin system HicA family toxin [Mycobacterium heidelbergense]|uniref:type II toxin-antitoxin system HicA family toxin n=1 Tax=Mycobacterium heidelbergense TaxID=53376 RepID=UPI003CEA25E9